MAAGRRRDGGKWRPIGFGKCGSNNSNGSLAHQEQARKRRRSNKQHVLRFDFEIPKKKQITSLRSKSIYEEGGWDEPPYIYHIPRTHSYDRISRTSIQSYARSDDWRLSLFEILPKVATEGGE